jgi:hypothetical protein
MIVIAISSKDRAFLKRFWTGSSNSIQPDRRIAYDLLRQKLVFISFSEIQHLVNRTFPVFARQIAARRVAAKSDVPKYLVWAKPETRKLYEDTLARTLFIGLSDGAGIDSVRRANTGTICNDQVALGYEISNEKWRDLHEDLCKRTGDPKAAFEVLFLIDVERRLRCRSVVSVRSPLQNGRQ